MVSVLRSGSSGRWWKGGWRGALAAAALAASAACSSSSDSNPTLAVAPTSWTLAADQDTKQFTATLTGADGPVTWSIETAGTVAEVGTVVGGLYTRPPALTAARTVVIKASYGSLAAHAAVNVMPNQAPPEEPPPEPDPVVTTQAPLAIEVLDASTLLPIAGGFRWLIEENAMIPVTLGQPAVARASPSLSLHPSYMPVVAGGEDGFTNNPKHEVSLVPGRRYFVSVLPKATNPDGSPRYQMGGADVVGGATSVRIIVQPQPIPTAQIAIFAFEDTNPINNAPDLPAERGLPGFMVLLTEGGGTYGASGGQVTQDAFGNPIGTEYQRNQDGSYVLVDGAPVVEREGTGMVVTGPDGIVLVKNLYPGKYGVQLIPPAGTSWQQTTTIEGTKTIDAWVQAKEPPFMQEFGIPMQHVFMGFVRPFRDEAVLNGSATVRGRVVNLHFSRPPELGANPGEPLSGCWIGLNDLGGTGAGVFAGPCKPDATFEIQGVAPGLYQLVVFDDYNDLIIGFFSVAVAPGATAVDAGDVQVNQWFARIEGKICLDGDQDGFCDPGEQGIPDQTLNLRFRDGSVYQTTATNLAGEYKFPEFFPFFNWFVAEVDFLRFKATGATAIVDAGGPVPAHDGWTVPSRNKLTPQPQYEVDPITGFATTTPAVNPNTGNNLSRTETGPVLLEGFQAFAGLTNVIEWGKALYGPGENGGISGIVHYASTRAEDDPRYAAADNWEPKIPRVQVVLYRDHDGDGKIDAPEYAATTLSSVGYVGVLADVDNWPFGWSEGGAKGPEDEKRSTRGDAATFDAGDAYDLVWTDSWDDAPPQGCQGPTFVGNGQPMDCFDGLPNFNQVRPAVFDGGYAFMSDPANPDASLPAGTYVVEAVTPPGYEHVKEEDKNVDFGDAYVPSPLLLPPVCVGPRRLVPAELTLFPGIPTALGGQITRRCDRKQIEVKDGQNAAVDFFMFTPVPVSAHVVALVTDDLNNGTNLAAPFAGEKLSMGFVPMAMHDWTGLEVTRAYTDQYGIAQFLVPSTFSANVPAPSGYAPNMLRVCVNSPGHHDPLDGQWIPDVWFDRSHSHTCYSFNYMPGKTTYLDVPVIPLAAFASRQDLPVDCEPAGGTPVIATVEGRSADGATSHDGPRLPAAGGTVRITSAGVREVPNPAWDGTTAARTVLRDNGFGPDPGRVTLGGVELGLVSWDDAVVVASVPSGAATGQLELERAGGARTEVGVTLTIEEPGDVAPIVVSPGQSIQAAIESAAPGQLILVRPGEYREMLFVHKPVRLQGWGAPSTIIDGVKTVTSDSLSAWRSRLAAHVTAGDFDLLPGQVAGPTLLAFEEGPAVLVAGNAGEFGGAAAARIDGFTVTGASEGGGILVSGHGGGIQISNNDVISNGGTFGGGIRVGHPQLAVGGAYTDAHNDGVAILRNRVALNGGASGVAGGIALCTGSDGYVVRENQVCGNFSNGHGGGIGHAGLSRDGTIEGNVVRFNQAYQQGEIAHGGGIFVGGLPALAGGLSPGSGSVRIAANLLQGNFAGTGDGGGIRLQFVNGQDVQAAPASSAAWYEATVENNVVVNNVAANAGGGISLQDVARARIVNNTVANNDSTGTSMAAFAAGTPNQSVPQPAGIVAWAHSGALDGAIEVPGLAPHADPVLANNVIWHNRSFSWRVDTTVVPPVQGLVPDVGLGAPPDYSDLGVLGIPGELHPEYCLLSDPAYAGTGTTNAVADPLFVAEYVNGDRRLSVTQPDLVPPSSMATYAAFDEGGNFLSVEYGPLTANRPGGGPFGDYHVQAGSPALGGAGAPGPAVDFDAQPRPIGGTTPDIGADERE
jgi:parallel beta-helix repeat protein